MDVPINFEHDQREEVFREIAMGAEQMRLDELRNVVDFGCRRIINERIGPDRVQPIIDWARERCRPLVSDQMDLWEILYPPRFRRIAEQWNANAFDV